MQPNRIDHSPITLRPRLRWRHDAHVALWPVPNVEHYEYLPRQGRLPAGVCA